MPPLRAVRLPLIQDLLSQMRFAPREALVRLIERCEALTAELDAEAAYPRDWVLFRITGYRPEGHATANVAGHALLADLSATIEHWCQHAGLTAADAEGWLAPMGLAKRWGVSTKTIARLRREGLLARRVMNPSGRWTIVIDPARAEAFRARHEARVDGARGFTRLSARERASILRRAARYQRRFGCSLNQAASRLASRFGRAHETIRQILIGHDRRASRPMFGQPGPIDDRLAARLARASRWGVGPGELAQRCGRDVRAVRLAIVNERAQRLRELIPILPEHTLAHGEGELDIREAHAKEVARGLGERGPDSIGAMVALARSLRPPSAEDERARARFRRRLLIRAGGRLAELPSSAVSPSALDKIETDLRWASRLKAELVRSMLAVLLRAIEATTGVPMERCRPAAAISLVRAGLGALIEGVEAFEPARGGRFAGAAAVPINRELQAAMRSLGTDAATLAGRASTRLETLALPDFTRALDPWQAWLEPPPWIVRSAALRSTQGDADARLVIDRFGLEGPPLTLEALAQRHGLSLPVLSTRLRRAMRASAAISVLREARP
jgi:RNA polymerase primary sigma factor